VICVLTENDDILVVNKPEGLAAIPERLRRGDSLFEILSAERDGRLYIVHRLDKETSGVIVFAKNAQAHRRLNRQFQERLVSKTYLVLVHGLVAEDSGVIEAPLRQFGSGRVAVDPERGKACLTEFHVIKRLQAHTLVEARPRTGRRHQIRVHLYHLGHPIVGDPLYGDGAQQAAYPRLMLHAQTLLLRLPSGDDITLEAPIPESFQAVLDGVATE
jgi:tRNA pseudouridine32 synthase/23S rRNA pseudouridine746 synthase